MPKPESHEYRILLMNGAEVHFTLRELRGFVRSRNVIFMMLAAVVLLAFSNPTLFPTVPLYSSRAFYWAICICVYALIIPHWCKLIFTLWRKITMAPLPLIFGSVPVAVGLTYFAEFAAVLLGEWAPDRGVEATLGIAAKNCLIAHVMETMALAWLLPLYRAERPKKTTGKQISSLDGSEEDFIVLNGRSIPKRSILMVQSAEHYLIITTSAGTSEYRARMKDFVSQMSAEIGLQTHRSYWVSADDALELSSNVVKTRSGVDIPVSRGRATEVRDWFRSQIKLH